MNLYAFIETLCKSRGMTISDMCRNAGVSRGSLGDLKSGRIKSLSSKAMKKISDYLDVSIEELMNCSINEQKNKPTAEAVSRSDALQKLIEEVCLLSDEQASALLPAVQALVSLHKGQDKT